MPASPSRQRQSSKLDEHLARQQAVGRRIALLVAAAVIAALLGPFLAWHFAG